MSYEDFVIQIGTRRGDGHPVQVLSSPAGEGAGFFRSPFDDHVLEVLHEKAREGRSLRAAISSTAARHLVFEDVEEATSSDSIAHVLGDQLFRALFSGQIRSLYDESLGIVRSRPNCGLRVKLKLDAGEREVAHLSSLPWEFLWKKETEDFLSLSRLSPLVRYLDVPRPANPIRLRSKLRILVAVASPQDLPPLGKEKERDLLAATWRRWKGVEVEFLDRASPQALRKAFLEGQFHALHFIGHGGFNNTTGEGVLFFEREDGGSEAVSGRALATMLKDFKTLGLVFLNACETARTQTEGRNPFSGVAHALVLGGLPSVIAMQFPISDQAAISFSAAFYQRLAAGDPIDAAVVEGRQAVLTARPGSLEWGTPVLFLRIPDASVFLVSGRRGRLSVSTRIAAALFLASVIVFGALLIRQASRPSADLSPAEAVTGDEAALQLLSEALVEVKNDRLEDAFTSLGEVEKTARSDLVKTRAQDLRLLIALSLASAHADLKKLAFEAYGRAAGDSKNVFLNLTVESTLKAFQWSDQLVRELEQAVASGLPVAHFSKIQLSNPTSPQSLRQIKSHQALARGAALTSDQVEEARTFVAAQTFRFYLAKALQPEMAAQDLLSNDLMSGEMQWSPGFADALDQQMNWIYDHGIKLGVGLRALSAADRQRTKAVGRQGGLGKDLDAAFAAAILRSYRPFLQALQARGNGASATTRLLTLDQRILTLASYTEIEGATP